MTLSIGHPEVRPTPPNPSFAREEFLDRCERLQCYMGRHALDLVVLDQPETIFHYVGHAMSEGLHQACLVPSSGEPVMVLRTVDAGACRDRTWLQEVVSYADWEDPRAVIAGVVDKKGWRVGRIGVDETSYNLTVQRYKALRAAFPDAGIVDVSAYIARSRAIKSLSEIRCLRKACAIAATTLREVVPTIRAGDTPRLCVARIAQRIIEHGGDAGVVGPVVRAVDDANLHAPLSDDVLSDGDILHTELIPQYEGYSARIMRPVCIGTPAREILDTAATIISLQDQQIAAMLPGVKANEVDRIMREGAVVAGLKSRYENITGYTLGYYQLHTCRSSDFSHIFRPTDTWELKAGMVFHMVTVACRLGFSETVHVTDTGPERLTTIPRKVLQAGVEIDGGESPRD